ncbi:hypothetical protein GCM10010315_56990 [Streptomyces luteosporeus]|uniref:Uncharacterized protein n=1 Tax=Streptomyces luteosporeus TaxID=173856 RepID=A0ABP6GPS2_9ACTN
MLARTPGGTSTAGRQWPIAPTRRQPQIDTAPRPYGAPYAPPEAGPLFPGTGLARVNPPFGAEYCPRLSGIREGWAWHMRSSPGGRARPPGRRSGPTWWCARWGSRRGCG